MLFVSVPVKKIELKKQDLTERAVLLPGASRLIGVLRGADTRLRAATALLSCPAR